MTTMRSLVVEDNFVNRTLLVRQLANYGPCDSASHGEGAIESVKLAFDAGEPYSLICLDIMMPEMDGFETLTAIRNLETETGHENHPTRILMISALDQAKHIMSAFDKLCDGYLVKPIDKKTLEDQLQEFGFTVKPATPIPTISTH